MAVKGKATDKFANIASIQCDESAANTITFKKLETGIATFDKLAWIINRVEYYPNATNAALFNGDSDSLHFAITTANTITTLASGALMTNANILHGSAIQRLDFGAAASGWIYQKPFAYDFSNLPGGGIIVPPTAIYLAVQGAGLAAATTVFARLYYTVLELAVEDYWELVEARRIIQA